MHKLVVPEQGAAGEEGTAYTAAWGAPHHDELAAWCCLPLLWRLQAREGCSSAVARGRHPACSQQAQQQRAVQHIMNTSAHKCKRVRLPPAAVGSLPVMHTGAKRPARWDPLPPARRPTTRPAPGATPRAPAPVPPATDMWAGQVDESAVRPAVSKGACAGWAGRQAMLCDSQDVASQPASQLHRVRS